MVNYAENTNACVYIAGEDSCLQILHDELGSVLEQSPIQGILNAVDDTLSHEFYDRYLHDFVCSLSLDVKDLENSTKVPTVFVTSLRLLYSYQY